MHLPRLSYANVVATIALFLALGGAAYAATQLPANSVGTRQLKPGAVTASRLSKGVKAQLGNAGAQGPAGPEGKQGVEGKQGKQGSQGPAGEALLGSEPPSDLYVTDTFAPPFTGALAKETEATVASIRLAPGDYLITAKAGALAGPGEGAGELSCELHDESGDVVDTAGPGVAADLNVEDVLTGPLSLSTEQTVSLDCFANELKFTFFPKGTRIMALPVASIRD